MALFHGKSLIASHRSTSVGATFQVTSPLDQSKLPGDFLPATLEEVDAALTAAREASREFRASSGETRATFLEKIADNLERVRDDLIDRAHLETGLPPLRLQAELKRTTGHLRMFAGVARSGSWQDPRIERSEPNRQPLPKPDLRRVFQPIGPVVVFGASNFPLAYSVAGGDTASALATGNPVIVKAHEAHPGTSELVGNAIAAAVHSIGLPFGIFSLLQGPGKLLGVPLVTHPATRAVGFTGSTFAGRILIDAAAKRPDPIPVFAEMGSLNPITILPSALEQGGEALADKLIASITNDAGQFCTKPGVILLQAGEKAEAFLQRLADRLGKATPVPMLHPGIHESFVKGVASLKEYAASTPSLSLVATKPAENGSLQGSPHLFRTDAATFLALEPLRHEYFGPLAILVTLSSTDEIESVLRSLGGQLTATLFCDEADPLAPELLPFLSEIAGRVIVNGVPTGVEVNSASQHGGPWPACSDSRFSAVGPSALLRFVRPVAYQNVPQHLLPEALR